MTVRHLLPDFSGTTSAMGMLSAIQDETDQGDQYEIGYKAGWDDAVSAQIQDSSSIGAELARNLQDLSFTYVEAHTNMVKSLRPLLENLVATVLPDLARQSFVPTIVDQLSNLAKSAVHTEVLLLVHPSKETAVANLADQDYGFPLVIRPEETVGEGQAILRFSNRETEIDIPAALAKVTSAVEGFFESELKGINHG